MIDLEFTELRFPDGFLWGSAASAHQTEGRNNNDWTEWEKIPGKIKDGSNSSIACDHYNRFEEDFNIARNLGHQVHRFSIEWSRIEPQRGIWNENEIEHYRRVTKALVARRIIPMITLHHFTNPLWFRNLGSWLNPESPELFAPYCKKMAEALSEFGVIWNTINEPMVVVAMGYLIGKFPPGEQDYGKALTVARHLLMAHGQAVTQIRKAYEDLGLDQPQVAPVLSMTYFEPYERDNPDDLELAQYLDTLYNRAWLEGAMTGRIPDAFGGGKRYPQLNPPVDFIGLNYYSRMQVSSKLDFLAGELPPKNPNLPRCDGLDWEVYPEGYYPIIKSVWDQWKTPIFLTENGIGTLDDSLRCRYILAHLQQVHRAINDGVRILGYLIWSLTDNFEWAEGYCSHFGLVEVDYETQKRTPRESAYMFRDIIQKNAIPVELQERHLGQMQSK